jgi:hypothetical protein
MAAIKGQGGQLAVGSATSGSAVTVTAATAANPVVLTATNSYSNGDIIVATAFTSGPTNLNNRAFVASAVSGSAVTLKGEDGSTNTAYSSSGGSLQKWTMLNISQGTNIQGFDGQSSEIDTTNLQSQAKEFLLGLQDFGQVTLELFQSSDSGQARLRAIKAAQSIVPFSLTLSDGSIAAFMAGVKQYSFNGVQPDGAVKNSVILRVTNAPAWFS